MGNVCECSGLLGRSRSSGAGNVPLTGGVASTHGGVASTHGGAGEAQAQRANEKGSCDVQVADDDAEFEDDDGDEVEDLPQPSLTYQAKSRQSVSAEAYGEWNRKQDFVPPVHEKSSEERNRINLALEDSFLFASLDVEDLECLLLAFEEVLVAPGTTIIKQGDDGDKLYLIESGQAKVYKKLPDAAAVTTNDAVILENGPSESNVADLEGKDALGACVNTLGPGDTFGELALMYNAPRAATVVASENMRLWSLDRETFTHIVKDAAAKKRELFEESLKEVSLLKAMDPYERSKIADALKTATYKAGDIIIKEGEVGDTFYLLLEGQAAVFKEDKVVMRYCKGGHFGELALLKNQPRAATVKAETNCKVAFMDCKSFKRLLGPVEGLLARDQEHYRAVLEELGIDTSCLGSS